MNRNKPHQLISIIFLLMIIFCHPSYAGNQSEISNKNQSTITLKNQKMVVIISPATLEVKMDLPGHGLMTVSSPRMDLLQYTDLISGDKQVSWKIPCQKINVKMQLNDDSLLVQFSTEKPGSLNWPLIDDTRACAFIIPLFEGSYIPAADKVWIDFLVEQGEIDTTSGLSVPFWGMDFGDKTLTYLIRNQFDNEITFGDKNEKLSLHFTHRFKGNWKKKEFGFIIVPGDSNLITPAKVYRKWLLDTNKFVSLKEKIRRIPNVQKLIGAAHIYLWGDGISTEMLEKLHAKGLKRLWLGIDSWSKLEGNPELIIRAKELGYLVATYDSYNSIHSPDEKDTWDTAQFDMELYQKGPIVKYNGKKRIGFAGKGYKLSPIAAKPYVRKRVAAIMKTLPFNSWFIDCDAYGELFDDFSELHPANQQDDMNARLDRMAYIRDKYNLVIGSEGGSAYAAAVIHFAHGMTTPVIAWCDPDLRRNKESKYYMGGWSPPEGPQILTKQVPMKEKYTHVYLDPRFRLPLYQAVFHDSVIATHHWEASSLKFRGHVVSTELMELLYGIPPLYHINGKEFRNNIDRIKRHYDFFYPLHKETALLPLTAFSRLSPDGTVQRTVFGDKIEIVANFGKKVFTYKKIPVEGESMIVIRKDGERIEKYKPLP